MPGQAKGRVQNRIRPGTGPVSSWSPPTKLQKECQDEDGFLLNLFGMPVRASEIPTTTTKHIEDYIMLYTIAIILIVLWLLGLVTSTTMGGFIHVLLVIAVIVILVRLILGRRIL